METKDLKKLLEDLGKDWKQYQETNDARLDTIEQAGGIAEFDEKIKKINASIDVIVKERDQAMMAAKIVGERVDQLEATIDGLEALGGKDARPDLREYEQVFEAWMRSTVQFGGTQADPALQSKLRELSANIPEYKAFDTLTGAAGGSAVPEQIARDINDQVRLVSPVRDLVKLVNIGTSDYKELLNIHGEDSAWVGETVARTEKATSAFRERVPTLGTLYVFPKATEESLDDMFFNVQQLIVDVTGDEFAIQEEDAFLRGDGTNKPTGLTNTAPDTTTDDASPARDADTLEYVPLDTATPTTEIDPDQLLTMIYLLRRPYRMRAQWIMNSSTTGTVRKLKQNSEYIWAPGLQAGEPDRLLGFPHRTLEGMDDVTQDLFPIGFGDFKRGYLMVIRVGLRMTVDNNITEPGYVKFYIRERVGGIILDNNAIKLGRFDT